jgi:hypothetical protein
MHEPRRGARLSRGATGLLAIALMLLGAIGPWGKALGISVSGLDESRDGWAVVVAAIVAVPSLVRYIVSIERSAARAAMVTAIASAVGLSATLYNQVVMRREDEAAVLIGWGLNIATVGSGVLALTALGLISESFPAWWRQRRPTPRTWWIWRRRRVVAVVAAVAAALAAGGGIAAYLWAFRDGGGAQIEIYTDRAGNVCPEGWQTSDGVCP